MNHRLNRTQAPLTGSLLLLLVLFLAVLACSQIPNLETSTRPPSDVASPAATLPATPPVEPSPPASATVESPATTAPEPLIEASPSPSPTVEPTPAAIFTHWKSSQVALIFAAAGLEIGATEPLTRDDLYDGPFSATDAIRFDLSAYCVGCTGRAFAFNDPVSLEAIRIYYAGMNQPWLFSRDNILVQIDAVVPEASARLFDNALQKITPSSVLESYNLDPTGYESWQEYYPVDRGQKADPANGRSQRTFNRWPVGNPWQRGQATWLYQSPDGSDSPPPYFPSTYQGLDITYYYNYHCDPWDKPDSYRDCTYWRYYIELVAHLADEPTILTEYARGGFKSFNRRAIEWEVFYHPKNAFDGNCEKFYILDHFDDAYLQDPANKAPLLIRLPDRPGVVFMGPEICALIFNSYEVHARLLKSAERWRVSTEALTKIYDPAIDRYVIKAINRYYHYLATVEGEDIFIEIEHELYWMRQVKPEAPLRDGYFAFWWFAQKLPVESDDDVTWADYEWCHQDLSQGPPGLGALVCEP